MYLEDRCHFNALSSLIITNNHQSSSACQNNSHHSSPGSPPPPPPGQAGTTDCGLPPLANFARRPILVDKQSSEPNTPVSKTFERSIIRGDSDLSQRIVKKRVTLRHSLDTSTPSTIASTIASSVACRCGSAGPYPVISPIEGVTRNVRSESSLGCAFQSTTPPTSGSDRGSSCTMHGQVNVPSLASTSSLTVGHAKVITTDKRDQDSVNTLASSSVDSGEHGVISQESLFAGEQATVAASSCASDPEICRTTGSTTDSDKPLYELREDDNEFMMMQKGRPSYEFISNRFTDNMSKSFTPSFTILSLPPTTQHSSKLTTNPRSLASSSSSSSLIATSSTSIQPSYGNISSYNQIFQMPSSESLNKNDDSDCDISTTTVIHKSDYNHGRDSSSSSSSVPSPTDSVNRTSLSNRYHHPHHHHHVPHRRNRASHSHPTLKEPENL